MNRPVTDAHDTARTWRTVVGLVLGYLAVSIAAVVVTALLRDDPAVATTAAWVREIIVVVSACLTVAFARRAAAGSPRAFLRLRLVTAIMLVAIVVIVAVPGAFPIWLRVEQAVCGVLLLGVVVLVNRPTLRCAVASRS
ncbi:MAG: hypothetical protein ABS81_22925 [Pseudonocardia sp. SCN 72-86]|nr:MAG: hypothetical protein ABS81_22925 [Pseudonocardia sp. SCN 72-86]